MRPVIGLALGDRYRLVRRLAVGGMGEVWIADDDALGREVAVKVLREEYTGQEDFLKRLRTEARNSAALSHPNIAQMLDYGEQDGTGYIVMELVHGEPLADLLEREPVLAPRRLLPILAQTARGLHHAHQAGVVHRDVKPGNILIENPVRPGSIAVVKITDFGVSLASNQVPMTATGMVMGTAQYLSPEQAIGKSATPLSDVYALGVVAYEATVGRRPFSGDTPVIIAVAHVNNPVPHLPASVHPGLSGLIMRMLEKDPAKRPTSAGALADELDRLTEEIAADPLGARSRTARRLRNVPDPSASTPHVSTPAVSTPPAWAPLERGASAPGADPTPLSFSEAVTGRSARDGAVPRRARAEATGRTETPGRALPLRREIHPRPTGRSPEASRTVDALRRDLARRRPADPAAAMRQVARESHATEAAAARAAGATADSGHPSRRASGRSVAGRRTAASATGLRIGPLRLSWPLVGLLVVLLMLVLATLMSHLTGGEDRADAADLTWGTTSAAPGLVWPTDHSGMILDNASRGETAATTTSKDV